MKRVLMLTIVFLLAYATSFGIALPGFALAQTDEPILIAEIRDTGSSGLCGGQYDIPYYMTFCFGMNMCIGCPGDWPNLSWKIGCDASAVFSDGAAGVSFVYNESNSPDWDDVISALTDGYDGGLVICRRALNDVGVLITPGGCGIGTEAGYLDGINIPPDLAGSTIDHVLLKVNNLHVWQEDSWCNKAEWDVTWQFWGGMPQLEPSETGGGQRSDVDVFLTFANPSESSVNLDSGSEEFKVYIFYGSAIEASSFEATLNGVPFLGFNPVAGTKEIVSIPLSPGRNVLLVKVDGTRSDGRKATDRDRLTFIVE